MRKPTMCICENKGADQLRSNCEADQRLCFRYTDSTIPLLFVNQKFPISSHLLCLYSSVCVGPVRKPHCWFSHEAAQLCFIGDVVSTTSTTSAPRTTDFLSCSFNIPHGRMARGCDLVPGYVCGYTCDSGCSPTFRGLRCHVNGSWESEDTACDCNLGEITRLKA